MIPDNLHEFAFWLLTGTGLSWLLAVVIERVDRFQQLSPDQRRGVVWTLMLVVAFAARAATMTVPDSVWVTLEPWYDLLVAFFGVMQPMMMGGAAHSIDKLLTGGIKGQGSKPA